MKLPVILALGASQTLAWASSVYLPAILADPIAHDLKVSANWMTEGSVDDLISSRSISFICQ